MLINKKYRRDYTSEEIVVERTYSEQVWHDSVETVPNAVSNKQISNQAVVFGNAPSRNDFNVSQILNHRGGLLASKAFQSYGCNAFYREYKPNFLVAINNRMVDEIAASGYADDNIVYTSSINMLAHPGKFYLIPYDPYLDAGTTAAYIACFDGHKKIYMIGFDGQDSQGYNSNIYAGTDNYDSKDSYVSDQKWKANFRNLARTYNDVEFIFVHKNKNHSYPQTWRDLVNVRSIDSRTFVLESDL